MGRLERLWPGASPSPSPMEMPNKQDDNAAFFGIRETKSDAMRKNRIRASGADIGLWKWMRWVSRPRHLMAQPWSRFRPSVDDSPPENGTFFAAPFGKVGCRDMALPDWPEVESSGCGDFGSLSCQIIRMSLLVDVETFLSVTFASRMRDVRSRAVREIDGWRARRIGLRS